MLQDRIRVGVIGAGFGAYGLGPAFQRDSRFELAAICSASGERATAAAAKLGIQRASNNADEILDDPAIDAVAIATTPAAQAQIALKALRARKHVFAEKPLAADLASADRMLTAAAEAGVITMVDFLFPEIAEWREAIRLLEEARIGAIRHACITWMMESYDNHHRVAGWKTDPSEGGGVLQHFGSHTLFYLERMLGAVTTVTATLGQASDIGRPGDTFASLSFELASGATAAVVLSSAALFGSGHNIEIYGSKGTIILRNTTTDPVGAFRLFHADASAGSLTEITVPREAVTGEDPRVAPVSHLVRRFGDSIMSGVAARPNFVDGVRVQYLLHASMESARTGKRIDVPAATAGVA